MLVGIPTKPYAIYFTDCPHSGQTTLKWWTLMAKPDDIGTNVPNTSSLLHSSSSLRCCASCGQSKPKKEFLKRLTLAQTKAFLKQPDATTRFITTSKNCKACQAKLRRNSKRPLTPKEIRTKMTSGDMPKIMGEIRLDQLKKKIPETRSRIMKEHWQAKKTEPYKKFKRHLQDQLNRFGNRHFASKNLQEATQLHNAYNYEQAKLIMKDLLEQAQADLKAGTFVPTDIQIASLIPPKPKGEAQ